MTFVVLLVSGGIIEFEHFLNIHHQKGSFFVPPKGDMSDLPCWPEFSPHNTGTFILAPSCANTTNSSRSHVYADPLDALVGCPIVNFSKSILKIVDHGLTLGLLVTSTTGVGLRGFCYLTVSGKRPVSRSPYMHTSPGIRPGSGSMTYRNLNTHRTNWVWLKNKRGTHSINS